MPTFECAGNWPEPDDVAVAALADQALAEKVFAMHAGIGVKAAAEALADRTVHPSLVQGLADDGGFRSHAWFVHSRWELSGDRLGHRSGQRR